MGTQGSGGLTRPEHPLAVLAGQHRAPGAIHAGRVHVVRVVLEVEERELLRDAVEDVLRLVAAAVARALLSTQLGWDPAEARNPVCSEDAHR